MRMLHCPNIVGAMAISLSRNHHLHLTTIALSPRCHRCWTSVAASQVPPPATKPPAPNPHKALSISHRSSKRFTSMAKAATASQTPTERDEAELWERVIAHQKAAARLSLVDEARTLVDRTRDACLSTISQRYEGFPYGSHVEVAADEDGSVILCISTLSSHRKDLENNPKCSLLIMKDKLDRKDVIVSYVGEAVQVPEVGTKRARDVFLSKHPEAFWVDFGDFAFFRIEPKHLRYMSGSATPFNATGDFSGEDFKNAKVDPIAQYSAPIAAHMNQDHAEETQLIVEKALGVRVESAKIIDLDKLGLNVQVGFLGRQSKLRIPFPRPAEDRKDVKTFIVQMVEDAK